MLVQESMSSGGRSSASIATVTARSFTARSQGNFPATDAADPEKLAAAAMRMESDAITRCLGVAPASVSGMVRRLARQGLVAVERYLQQDHSARIAGFEATVAHWIEQLGRLPGVSARRGFPNEAGQPTPRLLLTLDAARCGLTGAGLRERLWHGEPRIAVAGLGEDTIAATPDCLAPGEEQIVVAQIAAVLQAAQPGRVS